ncbi:MAG: Lrp/AsnC family transcriptional regulator [Acidimicrobiia bacterium]|nr:Lrp/AsnC family transcriptional regulator [Acidimicrobiia bacterium]
MALDALDRAILTLLQQEGRITNADLASRVHLSASACLRRVKRLEESGIIDRYAAVLNRQAIGLPTSVFVEVSLSSQHEDLLDEFESVVMNAPEVLSCHLMAGAADYLIHIVCDGVEDYERIHRSHLAQLPHVMRLRSSFAIRNVGDRTHVELR